MTVTTKKKWDDEVIKTNKMFSELFNLNLAPGELNGNMVSKTITKDREKVKEFIKYLLNNGFEIAYNAKPGSSKTPGMVLRKAVLSTRKRAIYYHDFYLQGGANGIRIKSYADYLWAEKYFTEESLQKFKNEFKNKTRLLFKW